LNEYCSEHLKLICTGMKKKNYALQLMLRKVFGPQWKHVKGGWRRLYGEEPHNYTVRSLIIIR